MCMGEAMLTIEGPWLLGCLHMTCLQFKTYHRRSAKGGSRNFKTCKITKYRCLVLSGLHIIAKIMHLHQYEYFSAWIYLQYPVTGAYQSAYEVWDAYVHHWFHIDPVHSKTYLPRYSTTNVLYLSQPLPQSQKAYYLSSATLVPWA